MKIVCNVYYELLIYIYENRKKITRALPCYHQSAVVSYKLTDLTGCVPIINIDYELG